MTESPDRLGQHVRRDLREPALHVAATDLQRDFSEMFGVETIERLLNSCYDELAERATVTNYLPLFAEALPSASTQGPVESKISDGKPTVLFLCTHNAGRSHMARGFFTHLAGEQAVA